MNKRYSIFNAEYIRYDVEVKKPRTIDAHHGYLILLEHDSSYDYPNRPTYHNSKIVEEIHFFDSEFSGEETGSIIYHFSPEALKALCSLSLHPLVHGAKEDIAPMWSAARSAAEAIGKKNLKFDSKYANCQAANRTLCDLLGIQFFNETASAREIAGGEHSLIPMLALT